LNNQISSQPELDALGVQFHSLSNHWKPIRFPILPPASLVQKLRALQAEHKFDIVHAHHYAAIGAAPMVAKVFGVPFVVTNHNTDEPWQTATGLRMGILRKHMRRAYREAKGIVCWSRAISDAVERANGAPLSSIEYIDLPIDDKFFTAGSPEANRDIDVVLVGRLAEQKNILFALEALAALKKDLPGLKAVAMGSGPLEEAFKEKASELRLDGTLEILGRVAPEKVIEILNRSKIHYMPSHFEGLSVACVESLAMGLDVVVSEIPSFTDPFPNEPGVRFVSTTNLSQNVSTLRESIEAYKFRSRPQFRDRFSKETYSRKITTIYRRVTGIS
jgi:glycosyltransferase involved in cell wall biosynthesis